MSKALSFTFLLLMLIPSVWSKSYFLPTKVETFDQVPYPQYIVYGNRRLGYWLSQQFSVTGADQIQLDFVAPANDLNFFFIKDKKIIFKKTYYHKKESFLGHSFKVLNSKTGVVLSDNSNNVLDDTHKAERLIPLYPGYFFVLKPLQLQLMRWTGEVLWKHPLKRKSERLFTLSGQKKEILFLQQGDHFLQVDLKGEKQLKALPKGTVEVPALIQMQSLSEDRYLGSDFSEESGLKTL